MISPTGNNQVQNGVMILSPILGGGLSSANFNVPNDFTVDFWTGYVQFEGDTNQYVFWSGISPYCECSVPDGGSVSFVIFNNSNLQINTYSRQNYQDATSPAYCAEALKEGVFLANQHPDWAEFVGMMANPARV